MALWWYCDHSRDCSREPRQPRRTRCRGSNVQVQTVDQNVRTARSGIPSCNHKVTRELVLNIEIKLLHSPLLKVEILCDVIAPPKVAGSVGCTATGNPSDKKVAVDGVQPQLKNADLAKKGGFCHNPWAPWFHDESWKIA